MAQLLKHHDGIENRSFLLTLLWDGRVKAERIRSDKDPRLRSKAAFALITLASVLPKGEELNLADPAERNGCSTADSNDEGYLLRQQIAESIDNFRGLFHALREATEDTMLEIDQMVNSGTEWRVCSDQVGAKLH